MSDSRILSIIVPNYKTPEMTKICFRLLRKYADPEQVEVIAVDNDSQDESTEYLRSLKWIRLIERRTDGESGPEMHSRALDEALATVTTPLVMVMHTDTFVLDRGFVDYLTAPFAADPQLAGVGSWKLEKNSALKEFGQKIERCIRRLAGRKVRQEKRFLRSHCAVYRTELLRKTRGFFDNECAGASCHRILEQQGYRMRFLPVDELSHYIAHMNHATMILNPAGGDRKTARAGMRDRLQNRLEEFRGILHHGEFDS